MSRYTRVSSKRLGLSERGGQCLSTLPFNSPTKSSHCIASLRPRFGEESTASETRQGAKETLEKILEGQSHGYRYDGANLIPQQQQLSQKGPGEYQAHQPVDDEALLEWDDLLHWQQDNEYIITNYRRATRSYRNSLKSIFRIHNETVNIWSHIVGAVAFLYAMGVSSLYTGGLRVEMKDELALLIYFVSVIVCFSFSFIYHIFLDHSHNTRTWTSRFDYLGIVIPLWGTTIASVHFGFHCEPGLRKAHSVFATGAGLACAVTTLHPSFTGTACKGFRTGTYVLLGLSSFLPIIQGVYLFGWHQMEQRMGLSYYVALGIFHATGAIIYACRIPERWHPRRYDVLGSSHQIMHVMVVCGAVAYGLGVLKAREHWRESDCTNIL